MSETAEIWKKRVASWRASGETAEAYSAGRGWSAQTLRWWSSRLGREAPTPVVRVAQLVRVRAPAADRRGGAIVIEGLDTRIRITIEAGANRELVATVLELVASRVDR